jgi:hypothetical protein
MSYKVAVDVKRPETKNIKVKINSVGDRFPTAEIAAGSIDTT